MTLAPFDPQGIKQDRAVLSRSAARTAWFVSFALFFLLLPSARVNGEKLPLWFSLSLRALALADAAFIYRRVRYQAPDERKLEVRVQTYEQLESQKWAALAFMTSQNIKRSALPPMPTPDQLQPAQNLRQLPASERSQQIEVSQGQAIATQSRPYDEDDEEETTSEFDWAQDLMEYPAILVWGPQGSGKTTFASWLVRERVKRGHTATILDPHREYGQWEGLEVIGDGMDYEALDGALEVFEHRIQKHYRKRAKQANYNPRPRTTLVDEFTNWANRCQNAASFFATALSDIRKVNEGVIFISHARTMAGLGGAKGLAATRDASLLELELEAIVDPVTKKARPALRGQLKYPGREPIAVKIAPWMKGSMDFRDVVERSPQEPHQDIPRKPQPVSDDPYAYRYPPNWGDISHLTKVLTGKVCCYPGCTNPTSETHHVRYQTPEGQSICNNPEPGVDVFGLCEDHHSDRSNPECAHHPNNWIKGERKDFLEIDSCNTREYQALLRRGWAEKVMPFSQIAA